MFVLFIPSTRSSTISQLRDFIFIDANSGQLSAQQMDEEFQRNDINKETSKLVRLFLREYRIIHQLDHEYYLVPSKVTLHPRHRLRSEIGTFPLLKHTDAADAPEASIRSDWFTPQAVCPTLPEQLRVQRTGLVFRRFLIFPPIPSGFWSSLISLFIQKSDIEKLLQAAAPTPISMRLATVNQLRTMIGNLTAQWQYWKTGILLTLENETLLRVNSLHSDQFADPQSREPLSDTHERLKLFHYKDGSEWTFLNGHFSEAIEVIVPEVQIVQGTADLCEIYPDLPGCHEGQLHLSSKILAKALEVIDEVIKSRCENLAVMGIYSPSDMVHLIPCPLCFGDEDNRDSPDDEERVEQSQSTIVPLVEEGGPAESVAAGGPVFKPGVTFTFTVAEVIQRTFSSDNVFCPGHKKLKIIHIAPDLVGAMQR